MSDSSDGPPPTTVMEKRYMNILEKTIPRHDLKDLTLTSKRQAAPEYSQNMYEELLLQEKPIGNYVCLAW